MTNLESLIALRKKYEQLLDENNKLRTEQPSYPIFLGTNDIKPNDNSTLIIPTQKLDFSYLEYVRRIKCNEPMEVILEDISVSSNKKEILEGILVYLLEEVRAAKKLYNSCESMDDKQLALEELNILKEQFAIFKVFLEQLSLEEKRNSEKNKKNLVYLRSAADNPLIYSDFESIARDYYPSFLELFTSLEDGTLKNLKPLANIKHYEVKGFKTRILFDFGPNNSIILFSAFVKKTDDYNKAITAMVNQRFLTFNKQKKEIFKLCKDPVYLSKQQETTDKVYKLLRGE